jgi:hypothetical protein
MITDPLASLVERGRQQVKVARFVGKYAVDHTLRELRQRLAPPPHGAVPVIESIAMSTADETGPEESSDGAVAEEATDAGDVVAPPVDDLVLPDYDHLPAAHVVSKLPSLTPAERRAIEQYELAHRHRRTILGKIEQLRGA